MTVDWKENDFPYKCQQIESLSNVFQKFGDYISKKRQKQKSNELDLKQVYVNEEIDHDIKLKPYSAITISTLLYTSE